MDRISTRSRIAYATGAIPYAVKDAAFSAFVLFFYTQVLGLSGSLTGLAIFLSVIWDAVSDPLIGAWSDRLQTRWGRRHPMMLAGAPPLALSFIMLFHPVPAVLDSQGLLFAWLLVSVLMVRTFLTVFYIPQKAMGAEITDDYQERTSIANIRINMAWIAGILLPALSLPLLFGALDGQDGRFVVANYHIYGLLSALVVLVSAGISIFGTRQFIPRLLSVAKRNEISSGFRGMVRDTLETLQNTNFRRILIFEIAVGATFGIQGALNMITWTYFWELTTEQTSYVMLSSVVAVVLVFPSMGYLAARWQKQQLLTFAVAGLVFNTAWLVPGRLLGLIPENGTLFLFVLVFVQNLITTALVILRTVNLHSIMADIADEHELASGRRQEGVFFAATTFALKFIMGFGYMVAGPLLDFVGLEAGVAPGEASASALFGIGIVIGPGNGTLPCGALVDINPVGCQPRETGAGAGRTGTTRARRGLMSAIGRPCAWR